MATFVYRRTHKGDPRKNAGIFGVDDCMGSKRCIEFDSVIGIGGIGSEPERQGIARKINWIGVGAHQVGWCGRGPLLAFDHFEVWEDDGPCVFEVAPLLAKIFCSSSPVVHLQIQGFTKAEQAEIDSILRMVKKSKASVVNRKTLICNGCPVNRRVTPGSTHC